MADEKMTPEVHSNEFDRKPVFKNNKERICWYLDEIDTYKEDMGKWYTIFIRRVIPMLVFFIPMNIIGFRSYEYIALKYFGGLFQGLSSTIGVAIWLVAMLIFLAILIFLPRFATFCEFVLGTVFYSVRSTSSRRGLSISRSSLTRSDFSSRSRWAYSCL